MTRGHPPSRPSPLRPVPASRYALRLTDVYRHRLLLLRQQAVTLVRNGWRHLDLDALNVSYRRWLEAAALTLTAAQREGVTLTDAYLATFLAAELGEAVSPVGIEAEQYAGKARDGRPLAKASLPPLLTLRMALSQGRGAEDALRMGLNRAIRITAAEALYAPRKALSDSIASDERFAGWRRVTSANPCGACLADAQEGIQHPEEPLRIHGTCRCVKEPVVAGVRERYRRPSGRELFERLSPSEQDELFKGHGGAEKAELIRSGLPLEALIARSPMAVVEDEITEAPLAALRN